MFSRKGNRSVGDNGTAAYTNVPTTPAGVVGGTANYPSSQKVSGQKMGYGYEAGKDVNTAGYPASQKAGYGTDVNTAGYPASQKAGYGKDVNTAGYPASQKAGYVVRDSNVHPQQNAGYGGGYVQQTPVSYGPDGTPIAYPVKKNHRLRNVIIGTLAVCCCCIAL